MLATGVVVTVVFSICALLSSIGVTLLWPFVSRRFQSFHPRTRAWIAAGAAMAPFMVATTVVVLCLLPGILQVLGLAEDHCLRHTEHPHVCFAHPSASFTPTLLVLAIATAGPLAIAAGRRLWSLVQAMRPTAELRRMATASGASGFREVRSPRAFSLTIGLLRPTVIVSSALTEALASDQLAVVLAHERAHVRSRDSLIRVAAAVLSFPLLTSCRRKIFEQLELASEQACDEEAAREVDDRLLVAETLLVVERLLGAFDLSRLGASAGFGGNTVAGRVRRLLDEPARQHSSRLRIELLAFPLLTLFATTSVHHGVEHLFEWVSGQH